MTIRPLHQNDIPQAMELSLAEHWNQTEEDWSLFLQGSEPVAVAAERGTDLIGTTTAMNYANKIAWIGMVLVDVKCRGQGISKALLAQVFQELKACRSVKLDATPEGQKVYIHFDFKEEFRIERLTGRVPDDLPVLVVDQPRLAEPADLPDMIALDKKVFGADRSQLLEWFVHRYPDRSWVLKRCQQLEGFALGRGGSWYQQVGPLVAASTNDAKVLLGTAMRMLPGKTVVVDVLDDKTGLLNWLQSHGFIRQRHFIRMYRGDNPYPGNSIQQYLIAGPEFG